MRAQGPWAPPSSAPLIGSSSWPLPRPIDKHWTAGKSSVQRDPQWKAGNRRFGSEPSLSRDFAELQRWHLAKYDRTEVLVEPLPSASAHAFCRGCLTFKEKSAPARNRFIFSGLPSITKFKAIPFSLKATWNYLRKSQTKSVSIKKKYIIIINKTRD